MHFSKSLQGSKSVIAIHPVVPCFNRIDFAVISSYIELPCIKLKISTFNF